MSRCPQGGLGLAQRGRGRPGQETLSRLLAEGIAAAPESASALEAVAAGLRRAASEMGPGNRELGPRIEAAVAASAELQERAVLKNVGLAAAISDALVARGLPDPVAHLAGEMGLLAFKRGFAEWSEGGGDRGHRTGVADPSAPTPSAPQR